MKQLPKLPRSAARQTRAQTSFGGYDHRPSCGEGGIYEMQNLTCGDAPLLATRQGRTRVRNVAMGANGLFASSGGLIWCDGNALYCDASIIKFVTPGKKCIAELNGIILVWPDKIYFKPATRTLGDAAPSWTGAVTLSDGTYQGEAARANTLTAKNGKDFRYSLRVGDAVTISGCSDARNNGSFIIRAISEDGASLVFYEDTFTLTGTSQSENAVTVSRDIPDLDYVCAYGNRLWGCAGDTVYCTRLGDPFNWYWYETDADGPVSTAAWSVDTGSPGSFTGCAAYRGCVVFTKPDTLYKLYGTKPENFQLVASSLTGAEETSGGSFAVAGETLFFLGPTGVMATTGGTPRRVGDCLGRALTHGVGGSDGVRYYLSARDENGDAHLFVYDTRTALWSREDDFAAAGFAWHDGALYAEDETGVWRFGAGDASALESSMETGDFYSASPDKKRLLCLQLRIEAEADAQVAVSVQYDSDGVWRAAGAFTAGKKRTFLLPLVPRRCDHFRLRVQGTGAWRLLSLARKEQQL